VHPVFHVSLLRKKSGRSGHRFSSPASRRWWG
jgi:hypothetical protein